MSLTRCETPYAGVNFMKFEFSKLIYYLRFGETVTFFKKIKESKAKTRESKIYTHTIRIATMLKNDEFAKWKKVVVRKCDYFSADLLKTP